MDGHALFGNPPLKTKRSVFRGTTQVGSGGGGKLLVPWPDAMGLIIQLPPLPGWLRGQTPRPGRAEGTCVGGTVSSACVGSWATGPSELGELVRHRARHPRRQGGGEIQGSGHHRRVAYPSSVSSRAYPRILLFLGPFRIFGAATPAGG